MDYKLILAALQKAKELQIPFSVFKGIIEPGSIIRFFDFPEARQATNFTCGAACVQAVLYYYGTEKREDELVKILQVRPPPEESAGVKPAVIIDFFEKEGFQIKNGEMTLEVVKSFIDQKIPVILNIQAWNEKYKTEDVDYSGYNDGHYVVAIGYTDSYMIFEDPSILTNRGILTFNDLEKRWHDKDIDNVIYDHHGIAVFGKEVIFDRSKLIEIR